MPCMDRLASEHGQAKTGGTELTERHTQTHENPDDDDRGGFVGETAY